MTEQDDAEALDENWTLALQSVERVESADPDDDDGPIFAVELKARGPNINADLEVFVHDIADESQVIVQAMDTAQDGLETWARVLGRRPGAAAIKPVGG